MQVNPYLFFDGNCTAAFKFYESRLGAKITAMHTYGSSPMAAQMPPEFADRIMHGSLTLGDQTLMASDSSPQGHEVPKGFYVSLIIKDPAEADRVFGALSEGATIRMPIQETFWAKRFGMLVDRFGIPWMVNCDKPT